MRTKRKMKKYVIQGRVFFPHCFFPAQKKRTIKKGCIRFLFGSFFFLLFHWLGCAKKYSVKCRPRKYFKYIHVFEILFLFKILSRKKYLLLCRYIFWKYFWFRYFVFWILNIFFVFEILSRGFGIWLGFLEVYRSF